MAELAEQDRLLVVALGGYHEAKLIESAGHPCPASPDALTPEQCENAAEHIRNLAGAIVGGHLRLSIRECLFTDTSVAHMVVLDWLDGEPTLIETNDLEPWLPVPAILTPLAPGDETPIVGFDL